MSVTTSTNTVTNSVVRLLADYELHHSDSDSSAPAPNPRSETQPENPEWWPSDHRRIPDYRPINRELTGEMRPAGTNLAEAWFITTMLSGVTINAHMARFWGKTGGKINQTLFRYPIGGER